MADNQLLFHAASLLSELRDIKGVTKAVINTLMSGVNVLIEDVFNILLNRFQSRCGPHDALSMDEIAGVVNAFRNQNVFENVDTYEKLDTYMDSIQGLVKPNKVDLLTREVIIGSNLVFVPVEWGYSVPFLPSMEDLLSCPEVLHCVDNPLPHKPGVFKTVLDGCFYRNHPLVAEHPDTLAVGIYSDGAEVTDSASSKSGLHGLTLIYWVLFNIHPDLRSSLNSIFLLGAVKVSYLKKHGYEKILSDFINGMNQLSSTGVMFNLNGVKRHFYGLFIVASGDNPGSANLGRFKESSSFSNKPCRQCYVSQTDLYTSFKESSFPLRSKDLHLSQVVEVESGPTATDENVQSPSVRYGINGRSALMAINGCDVTKCLPQDVMHDVLEGCLKQDICCILHHVIVEKKSMTLQQLNARIHLFSRYIGVNKPAPIDLKHITKFKLRLTASEAWNLAYILPFVLRKKNFLTGKMESVCDSKNLHLLILRLNLMDLLLAEEHTSADLQQIRHLTEVHHTLFAELYPGRLIPKMHYELHYATHILLYGPPRQYWCFRYEAKHSVFKRRWRLYRNLKDHAGSLSLAHQRTLCAQMMLSFKGNRGPFLKTSDSLGAATAKKLGSIVPGNAVAEVFSELSMNEQVLQFKVANVKGVVYRAGSAFITSFKQKQPVFGKVLNILSVRDRLVFLYQKLDTLRFERQLNSFRVRHTGSYGVMATSDLVYTHRLVMVQTAAACYITVPCRSYLPIQDYREDAMAP